MQLAPGSVVRELPQSVSRAKIDEDLVPARAVPVGERERLGGQGMEGQPRGVVAEGPESDAGAEVEHQILSRVAVDAAGRHSDGTRAIQENPRRVVPIGIQSDPAEADDNVVLAIQIDISRQKRHSVPWSQRAPCRPVDQQVDPVPGEVGDKIVPSNIRIDAANSQMCGIERVYLRPVTVVPAPDPIALEDKDDVRAAVVVEITGHHLGWTERMKE